MPDDESIIRIFKEATANKTQTTQNNMTHIKVMQFNDEEMRIDGIFDSIKAELKRAQEKHGSFNSLHEAIAVIREEYLELEDAVFWGIEEDAEDIITEATQLAAMAVKLIDSADALNQNERKN